jgi:heat shock protein HslJ
MRKKIGVIFIGLLLIILAACTPQDPGLPGTGGDTLPAETPDVTPEVTPQAVLNAQAWLSEQLGVPIEQLEIVNLEKMDWQDSCLGLGGPAESCLQAVTPGWRITFTAAGKEYEVRTDETGSAIRMVMTPFETPGSADPLAGSQWNLESFDPIGSETPVVEGSTVTLEFGAGGQAGGSGGCNRYTAGYQVDGDKLSFGQIASTLMACTDEGVMDQEQRYFRALQNAGEFNQDGDRLTILYDDGQGALIFVKE